MPELAVVAESLAINKGSCGWFNATTDYVVSVKTNHTDDTEVCGMLVNVTNLDNDYWVIAQVVDGELAR